MKLKIEISGLFGQIEQQSSHLQRVSFISRNYASKIQKFSPEINLQER